MRIGRTHWLYAASQLAGWTYFLLWVLSMYPQLLLNQKRRSVIGLNFDYLSFSLLGYASYALFNCSLYFGPLFQDAYSTLYPHSNIPVQLNDVFFSLHGVAATLAMLAQCIFFERANQRLSTVGVLITALVVIVSGSEFVALAIDCTDPLSFAYFFSYVKVLLTLGKYVPQAVFNYRRKSTSGWCIQNILFDINGGCLSIIQMLLLAINYADHRYFTNNLAKFGVGAISIMFDIIFLLQHYVLYPRSGTDFDHQPLDSEHSNSAIATKSSNGRLICASNAGQSSSQYGATTSMPKKVLV